MKRSRSALQAMLLGASLALPATSSAVSILFATVENSGVYVDDGQELAQFLRDGGHTVTERFLDGAVFNDYGTFDQVWVYDLMVGPNQNANQLANYQNIASWFNARTQQNLIVDGRIISSASFWTNANGMSSEADWIRKYAEELDQRGGGLMLGTDHATPGQPTGVFVDGINEINSGIGINPFYSFFGSFPTSQARVDPLSPLYLNSLDTCRTPPGTTEKCVNDNSTTSFAPAGLQPGGLTLTPVAYHGTVSDALDNAAVAATFGSRTFGTCGNPGQPPCDVPEPGPVLLVALGLLGLFRSRTRSR